jgi:hypothetical protein
MFATLTSLHSGVSFPSQEKPQKEDEGPTAARPGTSLWSHLLSHADSRGYRSARAYGRLQSSGTSPLEACEKKEITPGLRSAKCWAGVFSTGSHSFRCHSLTQTKHVNGNEWKKEPVEKENPPRRHTRVHISLAYKGFKNQPKVEREKARQHYKSEFLFPKNTYEI